MAQEAALAETEKEQHETSSNAFGIGSIVLMIVFVGIAMLVGLALLRQFQGRPMDGPAPTFDFTSFDGADYKLQDFRGKVVVLNFWASWCVGCIEEAPEFQSAWEKYKAQDVIFIGIAYADNGPKSLAFLERYGISYLNAPDLGSRIYDMYHVAALPETFIIDQNGDVVRLFINSATEAQLSAAIDNLLDSTT